MDVRNRGDHNEDIGLYLAILPPGGSSNGCSPATVLNWVDYVTGGAQSFLADVPNRGSVKLKGKVPFGCPSAATDGLNFTLKAVADHGADDFASCDTLEEMFDTTCSLALADDDDVDANNAFIRPLPIVKFP